MHITLLERVSALFSRLNRRRLLQRAYLLYSGYAVSASPRESLAVSFVSTRHLKIHGIERASSFLPVSIFSSDYMYLAVINVPILHSMSFYLRSWLGWWLKRVSVKHVNGPPSKYLFLAR